jgi:glycosyltransferase involved in cell wall biosynthesis
VTRAFVSIERLLARLSTRLLAVSEEVRVDLAAFGVAPLERIETVHLGIDLDDLDSTDADRAAARAAVRDEFGIGADDVVVAIAARLVPVKRIDRLLRIAIALGDVERLRVLVAGGGELQDELPRSAAAIALGERVCWLGFRQDIRAIYAAADIVVLTSDTEGTPTSLIEAAACGVPVVATDVGGVRTVVEDGVTGFVVPAADERAFARRVRELAADHGLRTRLGAAARDRARREFDIERMVGEIDEIYRRLLSEQGAQGAVEHDG